MSKLTRAAIDGFLGSFRLAGAIVLAIVGVTSAFVHGGGAAAVDAARHITR